MVWGGLRVTMTDDFLSNSNYYNKGGLNNKPKEPRPIPPKGQQSSNKSELIFKQLIHERNELRKYIIDICELLGMDTSQSILGANCLEFYAVLSSTAKNKIRDLQEQLKRKEEELQAQRNFTAQEQRKIYCVAYDKTCETGNECKQKKCVFKDRLKYKQALDEIRQYRVCEINDVDGEEGDVILGIIDEIMEP